MKKFYTLLFTVFVVNVTVAQSLSVEDLIGMTGYAPSKFDNYIARKGFKSQAFHHTSADTATYMYVDKKAKEPVQEKYIVKSENENNAFIAYETTSKDEYNALLNQLSLEYAYEQGKKSKLYQRGNITIQPSTRTEEDKTIYQVVVEKKALPKARDIVFAEDFLQLTSHEYLASVFGTANVKKDVFYFSDTEINKCSVLFPNTNMQVIFIWKDELNSRNIAFLLIGGHLRAQSSMSYHKQIEQNAWRSRQGIHSGMTLRDLQKLNTMDISIYGWDTDQPGVVTEKNQGEINFKNIGLVLDCLDCNEDKYYGKGSILNSSDLIMQGRRIYVSTMVILPE